MKLGLVIAFTTCVAGLALTACGDDSQDPVASTDAGADAGDGAADVDSDSDADTDMDAGLDGGMDAGGDASDTESDTSSGDGTCEPLASIELDGVVVGNTSTGWNDLNGYSCTELDESGPDWAYAFTNETSHPLLVTAWLYGLGADLDLFWLLDDCAASACVAYSASNDDELAQLVVEPGQTGFVVIDGYLGAAGPYQLQLLGEAVETTCDDTSDDDDDGLTDCADDDCDGHPACADSCFADDLLTCGTSASDSTSGADSGIDEYSGLVGAFTGPERIYALASDGGVEITATLDSTTAGLELVVLGGECSSDTVLAADPIAVTFAVTSSTNHYLVVDGLDGGAGPFDLGLDCRETACADTVDNDGDGPADCADPDCALDTSCVTTCEVLAVDGGCHFDGGPAFDGGADSGSSGPMGCYLLTPVPPTGFCHLAGSVDAGNPCDQPYDCRPGAVCTPADVCLNACDLDDGLPDCDAGTCSSIGADPVGVCW